MEKTSASRPKTLALILLGVASAWGCSSNSSSSSDADASVVADAAAADSIPPLVCDDDCTDFVTKRLVLPTAIQQQLGYDFDGDDAPDNGLAETLANLRNFIDIDLQQELELAVARGEAMLLARIKAASLQDASGSALQVWLATEQDCCPDADTLEACLPTANVRCFDSSSIHRPLSGSPDDMRFGAEIAQGKLTAGPATLTIRLTFGDGAPSDLLLENARIEGDVSSSAISNGLIAGTISRETLDNVLITSLAELLLEKADDGGDTGKIITDLFDKEPKDGILTLSEIVDDELMDVIFNPDVDVDGDGQNELSLGLGFEAVAVEIRSQ
jgi:hypothetical protein